jgi:hypothetical protein
LVPGATEVEYRKASEPELGPAARVAVGALVVGPAVALARVVER